MPIAFDVIAFDLDGTLADTAPDLAASLNHVLRELGRDVIPPNMVRHLVGHGARSLIRKGLAVTGGSSEELVERGYPLFMDYYGANICNGTMAFDGAEAALDDLASRGIMPAICTNKPESLAVSLVQALGWAGRFAAIVGGDTLPTRKPDPAMVHESISRAGGGRAAFVGDSIIDAEAARAARLPFVAVSFGFSDRPADQLGADRVIDSFAELVPALEAVSAAP